MKITKFHGSYINTILLTILDAINKVKHILAMVIQPLNINGQIVELSTNYPQNLKWSLILVFRCIITYKSSFLFRYVRYLRTSCKPFLVSFWLFSVYFRFIIIISSWKWLIIFNLSNYIIHITFNIFFY